MRKNRRDPDPGTKAALDDTIARFYKTALEMRSSILRENPAIRQKEYRVAIYRMLIPCQNDLMMRFVRSISQDDMVYLSNALTDKVMFVVEMPTSADIRHRD